MLRNLLSSSNMKGTASWSRTRSGRDLVRRSPTWSLRCVETAEGGEQSWSLSSLRWQSFAVRSSDLTRQWNVLPSARPPRRCPDPMHRKNVRFASATRIYHRIPYEAERTQTESPRRRERQQNKVFSLIRLARIICTRNNIFECEYFEPRADPENIEFDRLERAESQSASGSQSGFRTVRESVR